VSTQVYPQTAEVARALLGACDAIGYPQASVRVDGDYFRVPDAVADAYHRAAGAPAPAPEPVAVPESDVKPKPRTARSKTTTEA
jgi:hypothetical protein